ncbi:phosphate ABC transporter substrate-binding protein [Pseudoduganella sp. LjRoot289]|uniref:phosphate ABC transporter substrate-binding protein n=1 Tax=Pseudoduganella sp. LjRoot289 TaxID=3342314 RepID=UPI003ECDDCD8
MLNRLHARRHAASLLCCLLCACALPAQAQAQAQSRGKELVVIVSARSPVTTLLQQQVADIFLAQAARFPGGGDAVPVDQRLGSTARDEFYSKVAGRSPAWMTAHWTKMIFTGRGRPPREAAGNAAVRRLVAANPALIGYIERSALNASVRAVLVVK